MILYVWDLVTLPASQGQRLRVHYWKFLCACVGVYLCSLEDRRRCSCWSHRCRWSCSHSRCLRSHLGLSHNVGPQNLADTHSYTRKNTQNVYYYLATGQDLRTHHQFLLNSPMREVQRRTIESVVWFIFLHPFHLETPLHVSLNSNTLQLFLQHTYFLLIYFLR